MQQRRGLRERIYQVVFLSDTLAGKAFDVAVIVSIVASVLVVMLDSVTAIEVRWGQLLYRLEWFFTLLFTAEYLLRLGCAHRPGRYARSFFGLIDLLAVLPAYVAFLFAGSPYLMVIRLVRILRIFRVLKLAQYVSESDLLVRALRASARKILVFLFAVVTLVTIAGALMYLIEGERHGFSSIPHSVYWAVVTLTTVGYGDISPQTLVGRMLASILMILGYGIIAVPTGIVTVEIGRAGRGLTCAACGGRGHDADARYCKYCGNALQPGAVPPVSRT